MLRPTAGLATNVRGSMNRALPHAPTAPFPQWLRPTSLLEPAMSPVQASEKSHTVRQPPKGGVLEGIVGLVAIVGYFLSIVVGGLHEPLVWAVVAAITFMALGALALMRSQK